MGGRWHRADDGITDLVQQLQVPPTFTHTPTARVHTAHYGTHTSNAGAQQGMMIAISMVDSRPGSLTDR